MTDTTQQVPGRYSHPLKYDHLRDECHRGDQSHQAAAAYGVAVKALQAGQRRVLVTVLRVQGSTPRDPGARMWVGPQGVSGTIGGGNLEWQSLAHARQMLAGSDLRRDLRRYPLGPSLGQCCGGVVWLAFELLDGRDLPWCMAVHAALCQGEAVSRCVPLGDGEPTVTTGPTVSRRAGSACCWDETANNFTDIMGITLADVVVCGAGHIGQALVRVLAELPVRVTWLDPRSDCWPADVPAHVSVLQGDAEDVVDLPDGAWWLVLTHSHALDLDIVSAVLKYKRFRFLGLIGSRTKKARFVARLRERHPADLVARMQCPIGLVSTASKEPAVIAVSVAAQLLSLMRV